MTEKDYTNIDYLTDNEVLELAAIVHSSELQKKALDQQDPRSFIIFDLAKQEQMFARLEEMAQDIDASCSNPGM